MSASETEPTDETLAARAAGGETSAFEAIVGRYQARVFRLACRLTSDTDAPDVLQETFLQVYRRLASFRGESRFATWLYRIASNAALMHRRAKARRPAEPLDAFLPRFDSGGTHVATPAELQVAARADELLDRQFLADKAREVLARLPDLYREAFVLRGETIGLIGCGNLGRALIPLLAPFRPRLLIHDPWLPDALVREFGGEPASLDAVLREPRVIFALAGVTEENTRLLNRARLESVRSDAVLVLLSRAGLVDFDALIDLVAAGRFRAATDVFPVEPVAANDRVREVEGLILSAHRAGGLPSALAAIGEMVVEDLDLILRGLPPQRLQSARPETVRRWRNPPGRTYTPGTRL